MKSECETPSKLTHTDHSSNRLKSQSTDQSETSKQAVQYPDQSETYRQEIQCPDQSKTSRQEVQCPDQSETSTTLALSQQAIQCLFCGKILSSPQYLQIHARVHTGDLPYKCEVCLRRFVTREQLMEHSVMYHGYKPLWKH